MAIFKTKPDPNAVYAITPELTEAMVALQEALDARARVDATIAKNAGARKAASDVCDAAEETASRLHTDLALEIDEAKIIALESAVERAQKEAHEAAVAFDRADRLQGALYARAPAADATIAAAREKFTSALSVYSRATNEALAIEAQEAVQNLIAVIKRGHAIAAAIGSLARYDGFLGSTLIPSPAPGAQALIGNGIAETLDGSRIDLAAASQNDPSTKALADVMRPLADLRQRAAGHRAFSPPPPPAAPYVAQNRRAAEEIAAERAADAAWKPPASTWVGHVHRLDGSRPGNVRGVELNVVAGIADEAMKPSDAA
jgi:hypothetical protein